MRRNSKFVILALAGVASLVAASTVIICAARTSSAVRLSLQSYTNACAVIAIRNQSFRHVDYTVMVQRKIGGKWPQGWAVGTRIPEHQFGSLSPGQLTNLSIPVMVYAPSYPWRISVLCTPPLIEPTNSVRFRAALWCAKCGLRKMAGKLMGGGDSKVIQISTPEMDQWEK